MEWGEGKGKGMGWGSGKIYQYSPNPPFHWPIFSSPDCKVGYKQGGGYFGPLSLALSNAYGAPEEEPQQTAPVFSGFMLPAFYVWARPISSTY